MTKIISSAKNVLSILFLLVLTAVVAGFVSGAVNMERLGYVAAVFRGELPEAAVEPPELTEQQRNELAAEKRQRTKDGLRQRDVESAVDVHFESMKELIGSVVEDIQKDITAKIEKFEKEKQAFYEERKRIADDVKTEEFRQQVSILEKAEPAEAAKLLKDMDDKRILQLLMELKPQITVDILRELNKSPARSGQGVRGAELYEMMGEYRDSLGAIESE